MFEGRGTETTQEDGHHEKSTRQESEAKFEFSKEELEAMTEDGLNQVFKDMAAAMARQKSTEMWKAVNRGVERVGNVVSQTTDAVESVFEAFSKIRMDFDSNGQPFMPEFVAGSEVLPKLQEALKQIEADPMLRARMEDLMKIKKEEWRARESSRRLVG